MFIFVLNNNKNYIMHTQTQTQAEDKILKFIDGPLTKILVFAVIGSLLALVIYNGILQGGFNSGSWGL